MAAMFLAWLADWWPWLTAAVVLALIGWVCWPASTDYRSRNDRAAALAILYTDPPTHDTEHGTDAALQDECELLFGMPDYVDPETAAGTERLLDAVRKEKQREDGRDA